MTPVAYALGALSTLGRRPPRKNGVEAPGVVTGTNYQKGIYRIGYVPTPEELSRAVW